jgi:hypothetical protein
MLTILSIWIRRVIIIRIYNLIFHPSLIEPSLVYFILNLHKHRFVLLIISFWLQFYHSRMILFRFLDLFVLIDFLFRFNVVDLPVHFEFFQWYHVYSMLIQTPYTISNSWTNIIVLYLDRFIFYVLLFWRRIFFLFISR